MMEPTDLVQEIMARWDWDNPHVNFHVDQLTVIAHWVDGTDEDPPELTLVGPADGLMVLAYDAAVMWHSEASDHDACKVEVVEQTAHFPSSYAYALVGVDAVVTVKILDYLT